MSRWLKVSGTACAIAAWLNSKHTTESVTSAGSLGSKALAFSRFISKSDVNSGSVIEELSLIALANLNTNAIVEAINRFSIMTSSLSLWDDLPNKVWEFQIKKTKQFCLVFFIALHLI
ncbi:hypothetical protein [Undibacterium sp. GrIS 1.2]|uniref:hypothetical protein n=1 Tax=Undibacterium sp. GrIS 1.2 TaxID=3143933 RepID=UPI003396C838